MLTLSLDTSTNRGTVALCENGSVLKAVEWDKQSSHSEKIVTEIDGLFKACQRELSQTKKIICGVGPGSFTGLRVALSFARTLANSLSIPIVAIEDCWAIALNAEKIEKPISVVLDAQKNMFFYGQYQWDGSILKTIESVSLITSDDLTTRRGLVCEWITNVPDFFSQQKISISTLEPFPSAAKIYTQVSQYPEKHEEIHWQDLAPLYLRASAAEEVLAQRKK